MKKIYFHYKTIKKDVRCLLELSIVGYFGIEVLNNYRELFIGAHKIGEFFSNLCISTVSAFIFYFIVVHIKEEKDRKNVGEYVGLRVADIITTGHLFFSPFSKKAFKDLELSDLKRSVLDAVERTATDTNYIANHELLSWLDCYELHKKSTLASIDVILARYNHLDTELIKILSRIEHSMFFHQWGMLYNFQDSTFGMYQTQLKTYFLLIKELEEYAQTKFCDTQVVRGEFWKVNEIVE